MSAEIGLPEALERAASALPDAADAIRPANGDPGQLARELDPEGAVAVLAWLLEHEPAAGSELAVAWAEDPETAGPVLELSPESLPKPARKAMRRVLHRLRSQGVAVPSAPPTATVAKLAPVDERIDEARVTALDPQGTRLVYLAQDHPSRGVRLFEIAVDDERGVLEFEIFEAGRSQAKKFLREAERRERWPAVPVASASARALIAAAAERHTAERPPPRHLAEWRSRLCTVEPGTPTPASLVRQALGEGADPLDAQGLGDWLDAGRVGPWPPAIERVRPLLDRLEEISQGLIVVSGVRRREQVEQAVSDALEAIFDEAWRGRLADRFEEMAYVWWRADPETPDARRALATASLLRTGGEPALALGRLLLERVLAPALERAREEKDSEGDASDAPAGADDDAPRIVEP